MSARLSLTDLADGAMRKDCAHALREAMSRSDDVDGSALVRWARRWGLVDPAIDAEDLEAAEKEATKFEDRAEELETVIQTAIEALDKATDLGTSERYAAHEKITEDLEKALIK